MNSCLDNDILYASNLIKSGELVVFPTETVYGLGADATNQDAIKKIYRLKGRPDNNPLIVHLAYPDEICKYLDSEKSKSYLPELKKILSLMPGPITVVVDANSELHPTLSKNQSTIAFRVPNHPIAHSLIKLSGVPIAAPSANPSGYVSPTCASHVLTQWGKNCPFILDGGTCQNGIESTVISLVGGPPKILRHGSVTFEVLQSMIPNLTFNKSDSVDNESKPAPGMLLSHYAPLAKIIFADHDFVVPYGKVMRIKFNSSPENLAPYIAVAVLSQNGSLEEIAHKLFASLRNADNMEVDYIVIDKLRDDGLGRGIMDRLQRAAFNNTLS